MYLGINNITTEIALPANGGGPLTQDTISLYSMNADGGSTAVTNARGSLEAVAIIPRNFGMIRGSFGTHFKLAGKLRDRSLARAIQGSPLSSFNRQWHLTRLSSDTLDGHFAVGFAQGFPVEGVRFRKVGSFVTMTHLSFVGDIVEIGAQTSFGNRLANITFVPDRAIGRMPYSLIEMDIKMNDFGIMIGDTDHLNPAMMARWVVRTLQETEGSNSFGTLALDRIDGKRSPRGRPVTLDDLSLLAPDVDYDSSPNLERIPHFTITSDRTFLRMTPDKAEAAPRFQLSYGDNVFHLSFLRAFGSDWDEQSARPQGLLAHLTEASYRAVEGALKAWVDEADAMSAP